MADGPYIDLASDLHAELAPPAVAWPGDAAEHDLLLAGDVGRVMGGSFVRAVADAAERYRHVYVVLGNHEYYNAGRHTMEEVDTVARMQVTVLGNATLLQRDTAVTAEGITVAGCTLWSDTRACAPLVEAALADYRAIWVAGTGKYGGTARRVTAKDTSAAWERDATWLAETLAAARTPAIVLTHHGPHPACNPPDHAGGVLTPAFVSRLPLPPTAVAFVASGHTHGRVCAVTEEGVPLRSWCLGYAKELPGPYAPLRIHARTGRVACGA